MKDIQSCHPSIASSLASAAVVCRSRNPSKLAAIQSWGLSPHRLGRGLGCSCGYSWIPTWVSHTYIFTFCLFLPFVSCSLLLPCMAFSLSCPPLWDWVDNAPVLQLSVSAVFITQPRFTLFISMICIVVTTGHASQLKLLQKHLSCMSLQKANPFYHN